MGFEIINLVVWAITGLLIGWIIAANIAGRWNHFGGMVIGLMGGIVGGFLLNAWRRGSDWIGEVLAAVIGALLFMLIVRLIRGPERVAVTAGASAAHAVSADMATPKISAPDVNMPDVNMPDVNMPDVGVPEVNKPNLRTPDVNMPDVSMPTVRTPDMNMPDVSMPDVGVPEVNKPNLRTPDVNMPDVTMPDVRTPDVDMPDVKMPDVNMPDVGAPDVNTPDVNMPDVSMPTVRTPDMNMPDVRTPDVNMPDVRTPDVNMPDVNMPKVTMPDAKHQATGSIDTARNDAVGSVSASAAMRSKASLAAVGTVGAGAVTASGAAVASGALTSGSRGGMVQQTSYPDDLTKVRGIGKVYERRLYENDVFTWAQLARCQPASLRQWTDAVEAARVEDWPGQARSLAKQNNRIDAFYSGPIPDRLTEVAGVGESIERLLYTKGIYTYGQLAELSTAQLTEMVPASKRSADTNFESWLVQAARLQKKKR